jgi:hypothetical protein
MEDLFFIENKLAQCQPKKNRKPALKDKYPKVEYSATGIVMDTKRIHHQKPGIKIDANHVSSLEFLSC